MAQNDLMAQLNKEPFRRPVTATFKSTRLLNGHSVETIKAHKRLAREEVARANYSRFMPEYVVKQLLEKPDSFRLGGINQKITVLFADIRGFTALSENANPEKIVGSWAKRPPRRVFTMSMKTL